MPPHTGTAGRFPDRSIVSDRGWIQTDTDGFFKRHSIALAGVRSAHKCQGRSDDPAFTALRSVSCLSPDSLPGWAKGNIVASGCLDDNPDRVHNDLWLVDRHNVTGLLGDDQTSSF